jgi:hypothetical protein
MSVADTFIAVAAELVPALEAETDALRRLDLARLSGCVDLKAQIAGRYAEQANAIKAELVKGAVPAEMREKLKLIVGRVEVAGVRNATALQAAASAQRRVIDVIARAAERRSGRMVTTYGRSGRMAEPARAARPPASLLGGEVA